MEVYLDNSATTKISDKARDIMLKVLYEDYGILLFAYEGRNCRKVYWTVQIKLQTPKVDPKEIIFTSGGTEANNLAL